MREGDFIQKLFDDFDRFITEHKAVTPNIEIIPISPRQKGFQYVGGQIINKKAYSIMNSAERLLIYDIENGTEKFSGNFDTTDYKWTGGCQYNQTLFSFPRFDHDLLSYHPDTDIFERIACSFDYNGEHHYGGVCTTDGIIYQPPRGTNHILKWDIKNKNCEKIQINSGRNCRYCGSVIHPNGYAYFIPENEFCVIKMNLSNEEISYLDRPICCKAFDPKVAADGNIYGFSAESGILKIDTDLDKVSLLHSNCRTGAFGTKQGVNGKLYSLPGYTNDIIEYDSVTQELHEKMHLQKLRRSSVNAGCQGFM